MSRLTLAAVISVVVAGTAAPCSAELFSVEVPDLEGFTTGLPVRHTKANLISIRTLSFSAGLGCIS